MSNLLPAFCHRLQPPPCTHPATVHTWAITIHQQSHNSSASLLLRKNKRGQNLLICWGISNYIVDRFHLHTLIFVCAYICIYVWLLNCMLIEWQLVVAMFCMHLYVPPVCASHKYCLWLIMCQSCQTTYLGIPELFQDAKEHFHLFGMEISAISKIIC